MSTKKFFAFALVISISGIFILQAANKDVLFAKFFVKQQDSTSTSKALQKLEPPSQYQRSLPAPEIIARLNNDRTAPLAIDSFDVHINILGNIARTTLTMVFRNDNNAVLEGELNVPLDEGQTIRRFAMDVNGKIREAVPVEKELGRVAFETTVRKKIDPGLVEMTRGNSFRTRVYPIPANGVKTVIFGYDQELPTFNDHAQYVLPFTFKRSVLSYTLRAEVAGNNQPIIEEPLTGEAFIPDDNGFALSIHRTNYTLSKPFSFSLPASDDNIFVANQQGKKYFYVFSTNDEKLKPKPLPHSITLIWDASGSGANRQVDKELDLLNLYLSKIGNCVVQTVILRNTTETGQKFSIIDGKSYNLTKYLNELPFDGATNFASLNLNQYHDNEVLLFSDGIGNFGGKEITLGKAPIYAINSSGDSENSYLRYISQKNGGAYINLLSAEPHEALDFLVNYPLTLLSVTSASATDISPAIPTPILSGGVGISGIIIGNTVSLTLHYGYGGREEFTKIINVSSDKHTAKADFLGSLHAAKKIAELDMEYAKNKQEISRLGKEFSIVTRNTSLIVLDRIEDYVKYDIMPPAELKEAFAQLKSQKKEEARNTDSIHFESVLSMFKKRQNWYNNEIRKISVTEEALINTRSQNQRLRGHDRDEFYEEEASALQPMFQHSDRSRGEILSFVAPSSMASGQGVAMGKSAVASFSTSSASSINMAAWDPKTPYMLRLEQASRPRQYEVYLDLKNEYGDAVGFYLDAADFFIKNDKKDFALRILSNIAEINLESPQILRTLGQRLAQLGHYKLAASIFRDVLEMRKEEPQSYRDLALALSSDKKPQEAADLLYHLITHSWDSRFMEIELIAIGELNHIIAAFGKNVNIAKYDKRLLEAMPVDMRVVLTWDADNCDMDLWVTDPLGVKCFYGRRDTRIGGHLSRDLTGGYGPEEFLLKKAVNGKYLVQVNYYGSTSQKIMGPTTVQVQLFTHYATGSEEVKETTMRLSEKREVIDIGEFEFADK